MKTNQEYKNAALDRLRGNWKPAVLATLIYFLICAVVVGVQEGPVLTQLGAASMVEPDLSILLGFGGTSVLLTLFVLYPLNVGFDNAMRLLYERRDYNVTGNMAGIATHGYGHKVLGMFLYYLKVFLWTLLFFIPGIVMSFAYAMTPYILEEHPEISAWEASSRSRMMMKGHKFDLFYMYLSFIGWALLAVLTAGIGFLWLVPYVEATKAAFYNDLKVECGEIVAGAE